jgi:DNA-directed RNA polymerase omega subunit
MSKVIRKSRGTAIDIQKCVKNVGSNRFNLVLIASARAREISRENSTSEKFSHQNPVVTALEEIQSGDVGTEYLQRIK